MIGGPADYFYRAQETEEIPQLIEFAKKHTLPYLVIGKGSNLLFDDKGFRGLIIKIETNEIRFNDNLVTASAGTPIAPLIRETIEHGLSGLEKWMGLPGTVGGAVRGNAGCNGLETKDILKQASILDPETGQIQTKTPAELQYSYRHSNLKDSPKIVLEATFQLEKNGLTPEQQKEIMSDIRKFRLTKQPPGRSSGSFFKNPSTEKPAGLLIDQAGIKGHKIGNAQISEKHGNFFLNLGGATSQDIKALAHYAQKAVKDKFNIELEEEIQIISETGKATL